MTSRFLYIDAGTFLHKLHPNTKMLCLLLAFAAVLAFNHPIHEGAFVIAGVLLLAVAESLSSLRRTWKFLSVLFVVSALLWVFFVENIANPRSVWRMHPAQIERGQAEYELVIIILMAGLLMLAIALLTLWQVFIRDIVRTPARVGWHIAVVLTVVLGIWLLWRGPGLVKVQWHLYAIMGAYFLLTTVVVLQRLKSPYALALWLALVFVAIANYHAVHGFLVHIHTPGPRFTWGPSIDLSQQALMYGPAMGLRIVALLLFGLLFVSTTSPEEITQGLRAMGMALTPSIALSLAFRLVPTFAQTAQTVMQAQRARGLDMDTGGPLRRFKRTLPVLVPTLIYALRGADDLTRALETRGLGAAAKRTEYRQLKATAIDTVVLVVVIAATAACVYARVVYSFGELLPRL